MACFEKDHYEDAEFVHLDESGVIEGIDFYRCTFQNAAFQSASFTGCSFDRCEFLQCNLSLLKINQTSFSNARFADCKLVGIDWSTPAGIFTAAFTGCLLDSALFANMNLKQFAFTSCSLVDAMFHKTNLTRAVFDDCDLTRCLFSHANLTQADFTTSRNYSISAEDNTLRKTRFSLPEAVSLLANLDIVLK